jgi:hypothetical protein
VRIVLIGRFLCRHAAPDWRRHGASTSSVGGYRSQ